MAVVFVPLILLDKTFPEKLRKHNALISLSIDSVLLIVLCMFLVDSCDITASTLLRQNTVEKMFCMAEYDRNTLYKNKRIL